MAAIKYLQTIDMNNNEIQNVKIHILATDPTGGDLVEGKFWYNSTTHLLKYYNGTAVKVLTISDDIASFITAASTDTLTNKSIDGDDNTITDLSISVFKSDAIETTLAGASTKIARADAVKDYIDNAIEGRKWGEACVVATAAAGTLATSFANGQTVDGVSLTTGDRILIKDQADATENGVYVVEASGAPTRDETVTTLANACFIVMQGTVGADTSWVCTNDTITYGSTSISFSQNGTGSVPDATTSLKGKVELATDAETIAKTATNVVVTPSNLATFTQKYSASVGNGSDTSLTVNHALGTKDVNVMVYDNSSPYAQVFPDVQMTDTNNVTLVFTVAPTSNQYRCVVIG